MDFMQIKSKLVGGGVLVAASVAALAMSAAPVFAAHVSYTSAGARAVTSNADKTLGVADEKADSSAAYADFTRQGVSGTSRLTNGGGAGSSLYRNYAETILAVKACVDRNLQPDVCGSWG